MKRLLAVAVLTVVPVLALPSPADADDAGSGFGSVSLTSTAAAVSFVFGGQAGSVPAEMDVPYAGTQIKLGQGQATSSVGWPGDAGANFGSTLVVASNGQVPQQFSTLSDPAYARAQSGKGPATVDNTQVPGATMKAHATTTATTAEGSLDGATTLATTIGSARTTSASALTGSASAETSGTSTVRDVSIGGVVHIAAVSASARATTNGVRADASGSLSVTGVSVAGQPVTLDEKGLTVIGTTVPVGPATEAVKQALAQAQITLTYAAPTKVVRAGVVEYATGSVIASTPFGVLAIGGVQLRAAATPSDPGLELVPPVFPDQPLPPPGTTTVHGGPPQAPSVGSAGTVPQPTPSLVPPALQPVVSALSPISLVSGYGSGYVVTGLLLTLLAAAAFAALPSRLLPALADSCPLERPL